MKIEILKSIGGIGDYVEGSRREFALDVGMQVNVRDEVAEKWILAGIAKLAEEKKPMHQAERAVAPTPERAQPALRIERPAPQQPERLVAPQQKKKGKRSR